ncbi:hypothetical protein AMJ57_05365 [Parcubacteria bacterium SG8_24]|nr:MAG: hypothetical protein AMJ57_05365 [Parcubacteria bacterium SG8_24]
MTLEIRLIRARHLAAIFAVAACLAFPAALAQAGADDNVSGWAWSYSIGWISLNCTNDATCGTSDYGVTFTDDPSGVAKLSGWAWSNNAGWICFGETCAGSTPEGGASYAHYDPEEGGKTDQIFGWAQVISMGDSGWISLNCENLDNCATSNYFLVLNTATGDFTKGSFNDHYAWSVNDEGGGLGWINFSRVNTTWTPASLGLVVRPGGIYEPQDLTLPGTHLSTFFIRFLNFSAPVGYAVRCDVRLPDNTVKILSKNMVATVRNDTAFLDYTVTGADPIDNDRQWIITGCWIVAAPGPDPCAGDADCLPDGLCDLTAGQCRMVIDGRTFRRPIFTHTNDWTGLEADEDQYSALKCYSGFPGQYLGNAKQCDFTGDASFSLVMRRGIPVEGYCHDGADNDGNGFTDCDDRYCQGVSYLCRQHPPTRCIWGRAGDGIGDCTEAAYQFGDLCCSRQPIDQATPNLFHIVNGLECEYGEPNDGYFDCDCTSSARFDASPTDDCFAPGYAAGDLCCSTDSEVVKL